MEQFILIKIFFLTTISFIVAMLWTPILTHFLYKYKLGKQIRNSSTAPVMSELHQHKAGTPTMGGILIWGTVLALSLLFFFLSEYLGGSFISLNFLSRQETLLPLGVLISSALVGLIDDWIDINSKGKGGLKILHRLIIYTLIALFGAFWFYYKLDWDMIRVPFIGNFAIGWWYLPVFVFVIVSTAFSVNEADGLDGLSGGMLLIAFGAYGVIAFSQGRFDLAAFCGVIIGALIAFLWFNITPARFFMGDTGAMSLGVTLAVIAMLTNSALLLPIIGFIFLIESVTVILQVLSKKIRKKKIWHSTPIHHHFEALGWSEPKIVMRFWLISSITAVIGLMISFLDKI